MVWGKGAHATFPSGPTMLPWLVQWVAAFWNKSGYMLMLNNTPNLSRCCENMTLFYIPAAATKTYKDKGIDFGHLHLPEIKDVGWPKRPYS